MFVIHCIGRKRLSTQFGSRLGGLEVLDGGKIPQQKK